MTICEELLLERHAPITHLEPRQVLLPQRSDEHTPRPPRHQARRVERHPARPDRRHPVVQRLFHAVLHLEPVVDERSLVLAAVADHWPAVVRALRQHVDLVAALRAVLDFPERPRHRVLREAVRIAMSERPDLRERASAAGERIVSGHRAVEPEPEHLAPGAAELLGLFTRTVIAERDEEVVAVHHEPSAVLRAAGDCRLRGVQPRALVQ